MKDPDTILRELVEVTYGHSPHVDAEQVWAEALDWWRSADAPPAAQPYERVAAPCSTELSQALHDLSHHLRAGEWSLRTPQEMADMAAAMFDEIARLAIAQAAPAAPAPRIASTRSEFDLNTAVSRFLAWPLPKTFMPDCGVSFTKPNHPTSWPVGTNLFTADEAKAMLEHVLGVTSGESNAS